MTEHWQAERTGSDTAWADTDDLFGTGDRSAAFPPESLVTLRYLRASVRRHARLWILIALLGLAIGSVVPVVLPPASESSAKLLLTHREGENPETAIATDASLITTRTVAQAAITRLSLDETPDQLLARYTATALTDRVLAIDTSAPTSEQATALAGALADIYLTFRAEQVRAVDKPLREELVTAKRSVTVAEATVIRAGGDPDDGSTDTPEGRRLAQARDNQRSIEEQLLAQQVAASRMSTSRLLDAAAPVPYSPRRTQLIGLGAGLIGGLSIGIGFVVLRAMVSERLWRRQDVAFALGTRVRLSVGRLRTANHRRTATVVRHLRATMFADDALRSTLTLVSVDNVRECVFVVESLARSFAEQGRRVLVADLSGHGALAAALGVTEPGTHTTTPTDEDSGLTVHLPRRDLGPAHGRHLTGTGTTGATDSTDSTGSTGTDEALDAAWEASDLVLTLATVSPALGADHLRSWSSQATVLVTAGRSTATQLQATGEVIGLAGLRLESAILLGADRSDDSSGLPGNGPVSAPGFGVFGR